MPIKISCSCGKILEADERDRGAQAQCPACGSVMVVDECPSNSNPIQTSTPKPIVTNVACGEPPFVPSPPARETREPMFGPLGYLLIGGIVVVVLLACLIGYYTTGAVGGGTTKADIALTQAKGVLTMACKIYFERNGKHPDSLRDLLVKNGKGGPYLEDADALVDPWGQPFQYNPKGPRNGGARPDIWTVEPKTGREIGNWPKGR